MSAYKCKQLLSLLYECGIVFLVPPYSRNTLKSVVKTPRLHFVDSGLCCHLLGINSVEGFLAHRLRGEIFETFVVSELIRNARNNGDFSSFYFYREENGNAEIDLIKESNGKLYPIEIKLNSTPKASMAGYFSRLDKNERGMGTIICLNDKKTILASDLLVMPVSLL